MTMECGEDMGHVAALLTLANEWESAQTVDARVRTTERLVRYVHDEIDPHGLSVRAALMMELAMIVNTLGRKAGWDVDRLRQSLGQFGAQIRADEDDSA